MRVYRLEYPQDGLGPYKYRGYHKPFGKDQEIIEQMQKDHSNSSHPAHYDFDIDTYGFLFGCPSANALRDWFGKYFYPLLRIGFQVKVYDTHYYYVGKSGKQVIFKVKPYTN